jgi:hypothetical protein
MTHIHWVARQNKLEIPNDEEEVNTREIHKYDGQAHDPDTMVAPLTPKPTRCFSVVYYKSRKRELKAKLMKLREDQKKIVKKFLKNQF